MKRMKSNEIMTRKKSSIGILTRVLLLILVILFQNCEKDFTKSDKNLSDIKSEYGLEETLNVPENVEAIELDNISELEEFLRTLKKKKVHKISGASTQLNLLNVTNHDLSNSFPRLKGAGSESGDMEGNPSGWWFKDLDINIYWGELGDDDAISINSQIDGFTFSTGYTQDGYSASWNDSNDTITFHIDGSEKYYLYFQGIGCIYTNDVEIDGYYVPSSGDYDLYINN